MYILLHHAQMHFGSTISSHYLSSQTETCQVFLESAHHPEIITCDWLDRGKDKTSITKISCLGQTAKNFITILDTFQCEKAPNKEEVENFWREIWRKKVQHNEEAYWIKNQYQQHPTMEWSPLCEKNVAETLRTTLNWKAPGRDQTAKFCL
jgi:hypothetical protein